MAKQNLITLQLLAITGILFSVLVSMIAYRQFVLPVGQADLQTAAPDVEPPYVRVLQNDQLSTPNKKVFTVFTNTAGQQVTAADVVINYDKTVMEVAPDGVQSTGAFAVFQNTATQSGQVNFSAFSSVEREETMVLTNADQEMDIAQLTFDVLDPSAALTYLEIVYRPGMLDETNLILLEEPRPEQPTDILRSVNRLIVNLQERASDVPLEPTN